MRDIFRRGWMRWLRTAILAAAGLMAAMYLATPVVLAGRGTHPPRTPLDGASPADIGLAFDDVTLTTSDGVAIAAWDIPSKNGAAIILVHGLRENRAYALPVAAMLAKHDYGLLLIDMRAHGDSGGDAWSSSMAERDVLAAVDYLKTRPDVDPARIGLWGFSAGALAVIHAAARTPDIAAVAADAPGFTTMEDEPPGPYSARDLMRFPQRWLYITSVDQLYLRGKGTPTAVVDDIAAIAPRPVLLIAGGENPFEVRYAQNYLAHAGEPKQLWLIPDASHDDKLKRHPQEYEQHLTQFFDDWLNDR